MVGASKKETATLSAILSCDSKVSSQQISRELCAFLEFPRFNYCRIFVVWTKPKCLKRFISIRKEDGLDFVCSVDRPLDEQFVQNHLLGNEQD